MSYIDDSLTNLKKFEGSVQWMYLDTKGLVTVGVGEMLPDTASAQLLAFVDSNGQPATQDAILADYDRVSALAPAHSPGFYRIPTSLLLPPPAIDTLLMNHLNLFDGQLAGRFPAYASFPDPAKLGLLDMIYNLGAPKLFGTFPHFMSCVDNQDWLGAAANCHRVGPNQERNEWTKQQFMAAAAASSTLPAPPTGLATSVS